MEPVAKRLIFVTLRRRLSQKRSLIGNMGLSAGA